jgi:CheY-like chemotaxis protein
MAFVVAAFRRRDGRRIVHTSLAADGHTVVLFDAGVPAVAEVLAGAPDLVMIEGQLADMIAVQVCQALRWHPCTVGVPLVVCGHLSGTDRRDLARAAGTGRVLRAPLLPAALRAAVASAISPIAVEPLPRGADPGDTIT